MRDDFCVVQDIECDVSLSLEPKVKESNRRVDRPMQNVDEMAKEIMVEADRFSRNGSLTVSEINTFLRTSKHEPFAKWLLRGREKILKKFDLNNDGTISLNELKRSISVYQVARIEMQKHYY